MILLLIKPFIDLRINVPSYLTAYKTLNQQMLFLLLMCTTGCINAVIFKYIDFRYDSKVLLGIFIISVYSPYLLAEMLHINGIVAIVFSGISARRYIKKNISKKAAKLSSFIFLLMSYISETVVFLSLGMSVFAQTHLEGSLNLEFIGWTLLLCTLGRLLHVYPILSLTNLYRNYTTKRSAGVIDDNLVVQAQAKNNISLGMMHVIFFSGLRGAVAYACSNIFPNTYGHRDLIISTTSAVIVATMFFQGPLIVTVITLSKVKLGVPSFRSPSLRSGSPRLTSPQGSSNPKRSESFDEPPCSRNASLEEQLIYPLVLRGWELSSPLSLLHNIHSPDANNKWEQSSGGGSLPSTRHSSFSTSFNNLSTSMASSSLEVLQVNVAVISPFQSESTLELTGSAEKKGEARC